MNFEFNGLNLVVLISWISSASLLGLMPILISAWVLFSSSLSVSILALITLSLVSFFISSQNSKKNAYAFTYFYYFIRIFFLFVALLGAAFQGPASSSLFVFLGLLFSLPLFLWSILFEKYFESITIRAYVYSILLPAVATISVLLRIKAEVKSDWADEWDWILAIVGILSLFLNSVFTFLKKRAKSLIIHLSQAWIGLALFVLILDADPWARLAIAAISCLLVTGPQILSLGRQMNPRSEKLSKVILIGMPGFLSFSSLYYSFKSISAFNVQWIWIVSLSFVFQVLAVTIYSESSVEAPSRNAKTHFFSVVLIQAVCSFALFFLERTGRL